jgi:hypothetical protein
VRYQGFLYERATQPTSPVAAYGKDKECVEMALRYLLRNRFVDVEMNQGDQNPLFKFSIGPGMGANYSGEVSDLAFMNMVESSLVADYFGYRFKGDIFRAVEREAYDSSK